MTEEAVAVVPDRRQRRWRQLHDTIFEAACQLFLESDFESTSMDQIAERADVARKTVFNHFPRKRDLISEWGLRRRQQVQDALSSELLAEPNLDIVLRHYFSELATLNIKSRPLTIRILTGWREHGGPFDADPHTLIDVFEGFLTSAVERGEVGHALSPRAIAVMLYSSYFGVLYDWCGGGDDTPPFDLQDVFMAIVDAVLTGVTVRPGGRS